MRILDFVDVEKVTIAALKEWRDQEWKAETGRERVREISARMTSLSSSLGSAPVSGGGGNKVEAAMADQLTKKVAAERGYEMAVAFINDMAPSWERLSEDERYMLEVRFVDNDGDGIRRIMERYHIEKSEAYDRSNKALARLARLLLW